MSRSDTKLILWLVLSMLAHSPFVAAQANITKRDSLKSAQAFQDGMKKKSGEQYEAALKDFEDAINFDPMNYKAHRQKAHTAFILKKYDLAIQEYSTALSLKPNDQLSYFGRAEAKRFSNNSTGALEDYNFLLSLESKDPAVFYGRAQCLFKIGNLKDAIVDFTKYIDGIPNNNTDYTAFYKRGVAYLDDNDWNKAINDFNRYFQLGGNLAAAHYFRGVAYFQCAKEKNSLADSAIYDLEIYKKSNSKNSNLYKYLGTSYALKNDTLKARESFGNALNLNPNDSLIAYYWATAELNFKNYQKSLELLNSILSSFNSSQEVYYRLGIAKAGCRDTLGAAEAYRRALEIDKDMKEVYEARVKLYLSSDKYAQATLSDLDYLIGNYSNTPKRKSLLMATKALVEFRCKKTVDALAEIDKAIHVAPEEPSGYLVRAVIKEKLKKDKGSITSDYDQAAKLDKNLKEAHLMEAYYLRTVNDEKLACESLNKALAADAKVPSTVKAYLCEGKGANKETPMGILDTFLREAIVNP